MKRNFVLVTAFLMLLLVLVTSLTTNAHASTVLTSSSSSPQKVCQVYNIGLNGSKPATVTCLHFSKVVNGKITPLLGQGSCSAGELQFFGDANYSGGLGGNNVLCFYGYGWANMSEFPFAVPFLPVVQNWNDRLSSFKTGNACVNFWWNENQTGSILPEGKYINVSYIGNTWNDQVSSFTRFAC